MYVYDSISSHQDDGACGVVGEADEVVEINCCRPLLRAIGSVGVDRPACVVIGSRSSEDGIAIGRD